MAMLSQTERLVEANRSTLRVLALTNLYPNPMQPQRATFNRREFRILGSNHYPVRVIAPIAWTDELRLRRAGKTGLPASRQVELDELVVDHPRVFHVPGMFRNLYGRCYQWSVKKTFHRICREFKPTIIYAPWIYPDGWAAIKLAREAGLPVVLKAHGSDVLLLEQNAGRRAGTIEALQSADGIVAVSQDLANKMVALGADPKRVRVVYDGLESSLFHPGSKTAARTEVGIEGTAAQLLFIGNLVPVKGIDVLLKACGQLQSRGQYFQLHVIGEGPLKSELVKLGQSLGIAERVAWHGSIPQAQLPNWYRAADLFVLPSRSEGVPSVLLEACGCNTPWVATSVGGIPEIAHLGVNQLVSPESTDELAEAILASLARPGKDGVAPREPEEAIKETAGFLAEIQAAARSQT